LDKGANIGELYALKNAFRSIYIVEVPLSRKMGAQYRSYLMALAPIKAFTVKEPDIAKQKLDLPNMILEKERLERAARKNQQLIEQFMMDIVGKDVYSNCGWCFENELGDIAPLRDDPELEPWLPRWKTFWEQLSTKLPKPAQVIKKASP
jgi:hypothetical protein